MHLLQRLINMNLASEEMGTVIYGSGESTSEPCLPDKVYFDDASLVEEVPRTNVELE